MPSPFPGMDPYLEHPSLFPGLHNNFITYLQDSLQPRLPEPYYAEIAERMWVEVSQRYIEPDVELLRQSGNSGSESSTPSGEALAVLTRGRAVIVTVPHDERRETSIAIYARFREGERLVTSVEVLSRAHKTPGQKGRDLYLRKQEEILATDVNLVEIDLLRAGVHTTAVPLAWALKKVGQFDYHVCVHPFSHVEDFVVCPIRLDEPLPEIAIPLLPGDSPVVVDLQAVFNRCYETGPYRRRIRYAQMTPDPPLRPEQAEWANRILTEKGFVGAKPGS